MTEGFLLERPWARLGSEPSANVAQNIRAQGRSNIRWRCGDAEQKFHQLYAERLIA